jgi:hypothetical protein
VSDLETAFGVADVPAPPYTRRRPAGGPPNPQISLRIPANWIYRLRERAIRAAGDEDRTITAQEIVRRIIADALSRPL